MLHAQITSLGDKQMNTSEVNDVPDEKEDVGLPVIIGRAIGDFFRVLNLAAPGTAAQLHQAGRLFPGSLAMFSLVAAILMLAGEYFLLPPSVQLGTIIPWTYSFLGLCALTVVILVVNAASGVPVHLAVKVLGGKGGMAATVAVACAISIVLVPVTVLLDAAFYAMPELQGRLTAYPEFASRVVMIGIWARPMIVSLALIHDIPKWRSGLAIILSIIFMVAMAYGLVALFGAELGLA